jgi:hypothetical protein
MTTHMGSSPNSVRREFRRVRIMPTSNCSGVCPADYHHQHSVRSQRAARSRRITPGGRGPV